MVRFSYGSQGKSSSSNTCLLYTSDAADERSSVDLGGRRIIKKKKKNKIALTKELHTNNKNHQFREVNN